jgi:hypothetical protein
MKAVWEFSVRGLPKRDITTPQRDCMLNEVVNNRTHEHWVPEVQTIERLPAYCDRSL